MGKQYTVSDGELVLTLEEAEEGGFVVTSPMDPELVTEAETISEAFYMARDALETLREARVEFFKELPLEGRMKLFGKFAEAERSRLLRALPARERRDLLASLSCGQPSKQVGKRRGNAARRRGPRKAARRNKKAGSKV